MTDSISRQAAINAFLTELTKRERKNFLHTWSTVEVKYFVADMLEKLPSAQPEYERVSAEDVAVSIAPTKLASAVWLYGTLTELEKAGYVICRKTT